MLFHFIIRGAVGGAILTAHVEATDLAKAVYKLGSHDPSITYTVQSENLSELEFEYVPGYECTCSPTMDRPFSVVEIDRERLDGYRFDTSKISDDEMDQLADRVNQHIIGPTGLDDAVIECATKLGLPLKPEEIAEL